jgi:predicted TIM-barrel fold metal-dependent hydrolase
MTDGTPAAPHHLVDVNAMLGRYPRADVGTGTVEALLARMDHVGIAAAIVGHTMSWLHDPATGNRRVVELVRDQPRLAPCWVILPHACGEVAPPAQFIAQAREHGVQAVRGYPADHRYNLAGADIAPMLEAITAAGLPLLVDIRQTDWSTVETVAGRYPDLPVIVCEIGYRDIRRVTGVLERTANVYLDLADLSSHCGLELLVDRFGAGRILFGTGAPVRDQAEAVTRLLWSELDDAAVAAIGAANLRGLQQRQAQAA